VTKVHSLQSIIRLKKIRRNYSHRHIEYNITTFNPYGRRNKRNHSESATETFTMVKKNRHMRGLSSVDFSCAHYFYSSWLGREEKERKEKRGETKEREKERKRENTKDSKNWKVHGLMMTSIFQKYTPEPLKWFNGTLWHSTTNLIFIFLGLEFIVQISKWI